MPHKDVTPGLQGIGPRWTLHVGNSELLGGALKIIVLREREAPGVVTAGIARREIDCFGVPGLGAGPVAAQIEYISLGQIAIFRRHQPIAKGQNFAPRPLGPRRN